MASLGQQHPSLDDPNAWVPYRYYPSLAAAVVFIVLFGITTAWHTSIVVRKRTWYFVPFVIGGIFEVIGYIGRAVSTQDIWALGPFIVQSILLLVAPALFAASIYMTLGRIIRRLNAEQYSIIPLRWLTKIFVAGDVIGFQMQAAGGGIQSAGSLQMFQVGEKIIIAGLFMQVLFFGLFIVVAVLFDTRFRAATSRHRISDNVWKKHMAALYTGSGLILVRSVFRIVEYLMGNDGFILRHEYFLYIFDATLMFLVMCVFLAIHPHEFLNSSAVTRTAKHDYENVREASEDSRSQSNRSNAYSMPMQNV